jgi:hypothetical protein
MKILGMPEVINKCRTAEGERKPEGVDIGEGLGKVLEGGGLRRALKK